MWYQERGREHTPLQRESWEGTVVRIDYLARCVAVNVTRTAGPRRVRVLSSIPLGTPDEPGIRLGDRVLLVRNQQNEYVVIQHFPQDESTPE